MYYVRDGIDVCVSERERERGGVDVLCERWNRCLCV